ncbi:ComF family protein [Methylohalomonas lacus]|uniref:ComF family protein n=1 Tax=Methylohalomonas lacus TaxID=398773 RepID=A0AAE3L1L6_9GAMM|nr:ComF family protein [Methylohalomonas lacus]MCS3903326.1 ComF family protein [Methylohalomonas lacus]
MVNKRTLFNWLLPPGSCLLCAGNSNNLVCNACRADLPSLDSCCRLCALPLPQPGPCPECLRRPPPFTARAAFHYDYPLALLIKRLKFRGDAGLGRFLGECLYAELTRWPLANRPECLLPMPLHWRRQLWRGFNQSLELARPIAAGLGIPLRTDLCRRVRATAPQTYLGRSARRRNVRAAFRVGSGPLPRHVAIVDDVMTSGHTVTELARSLRRAGVEEVQVWALARAAPE